MPRTKESSQKIREERMNAIKHATIRVYASKGYLGTQMEDIAKEAGLAKGLLYYYFKSKPELFRYVFNELMDQALQYSEALSSEEIGLKEALGSFTEWFLAASFEQPVYPLAYKMMPDDLGHVFEDQAADMQLRFFNQYSKPMMERFASAMDKGEIPKGNPTLQALLFTSAVMSLSHLIAGNPAIANGKSMEEVAAETKQILFEGIFKRN